MPSKHIFIFISAILIVFLPHVASQTCAGTQAVSTSTGTINDGSGTGYYSSGLVCKWWISPSDSSIGRVFITFTEFDVENIHDHLYVYEYGDSKLVADLTGNKNVPFSLWAGTPAFLKFVTDVGITKQGWTMNFTGFEPTPSASPTPTTSPTMSPTATPSPTPTASPTASPSPTTSPTVSPTPFHFLLTDTFPHLGIPDAETWNSTNVVVSAVCGSDSGFYSACFGGGGVGIRVLTTRKSFALSSFSSVLVTFRLKMGNSEVTCDPPEAGENLEFMYSTNGQNWELIRTFFASDKSLYQFQSIQIWLPTTAIQSSKTFLSWRQYRFSGGEYDKWVIDTITVAGSFYPQVSPSPIQPPSPTPSPSPQPTPSPLLPIRFVEDFDGQNSWISSGVDFQSDSAIMSGKNSSLKSPAFFTGSLGNVLVSTEINQNSQIDCGRQIGGLRFGICDNSSQCLDLDYFRDNDPYYSSDRIRSYIVDKANLSSKIYLDFSTNSSTWSVDCVKVLSDVEVFNEKKTLIGLPVTVTLLLWSNFSARGFYIGRSPCEIDFGGILAWSSCDNTIVTSGSAVLHNSLATSVLNHRVQSNDWFEISFDSIYSSPCNTSCSSSELSLQVKLDSVDWLDIEKVNKTTSSRVRVGNLSQSERISFRFVVSNSDKVCAWRLNSVSFLYLNETGSSFEGNWIDNGYSNQNLTCLVHQKDSTWVVTSGFAETTWHYGTTDGTSALILRDLTTVLFNGSFIAPSLITFDLLSLSDSNHYLAIQSKNRNDSWITMSFLSNPLKFDSFKRVNIGIPVTNNGIRIVSSGDWAMDRFSIAKEDFLPCDQVSLGIEIDWEISGINISSTCQLSNYTVMSVINEGIHVHSDQGEKVYFIDHGNIGGFGKTIACGSDILVVVSNDYYFIYNSQFVLESNVSITGIEYVSVSGNSIIMAGNGKVYIDATTIYTTTTRGILQGLSAHNSRSEIVVVYDNHAYIMDRNGIIRQNILNVIQAMYNNDGSLLLVEKSNGKIEVLSQCGDYWCIGQSIETKLFLVGGIGRSVILMDEFRLYIYYCNESSSFCYLMSESKDLVTSGSKGKVVGNNKLVIWASYSQQVFSMSLSCGKGRELFNGNCIDSTFPFIFSIEPENLDKNSVGTVYFFGARLDNSAVANISVVLGEKTVGIATFITAFNSSLVQASFDINSESVGNAYLTAPSVCLITSNIGGILLTDTVNVTSIVPSGGPVTGGTEVVVSGSGLNQTKSVYCMFGSVGKVQCEQFGNGVKCKSPKSIITGTVTLRLSLNNQQFSEAGQFEYYEPPTYYVLHPPAMQLNESPTLFIIPLFGIPTSLLSYRPLLHVYTEAGGFLCTITNMIVNGNQSYETVLNKTVLSQPMTVKFSLSFNHLQEHFINGSYILYRPPLVDHMVPNSGPVMTSTVVTIVGHSFVETEYVSVLLVHGGEKYNLKGDVKGSNRIEVVFPSVSVAGTTGIYLSLNGHTYTGMLSNLFSFYKVDSLSPSLGPVVGGTTVTVIGEGFVSSWEGLPFSYCSFGSSGVRGRLISSTAIECISPVSTKASVPLSMKMEGGSLVPTGLEYIYYEFPQINSLSPVWLYDTGGERLTITGQNFVQSSFLRVSFVDVLNTDIVLYGESIVTSNSSIEVISPSVSGLGLILPRKFKLIVLMNGIHESSDHLTVTVYGTRTVIGVAPKSADWLGNTPITISGTNFGDGGSTFRIGFDMPTITAEILYYNTTCTVTQPHILATCRTPMIQNPSSIQPRSYSKLYPSLGGSQEDQWASSYVQFYFFQQLSLYRSSPSELWQDGGFFYVYGYPFDLTVSQGGMLDLVCQFGLPGDPHGALVKAQYITSTQMSCQAPPYPVPLSGQVNVPVGVSGNGVVTRFTFSVKYISCPAGLYAATYTDRCNPCQPGSYNPAPGATTCLECTKNSYCPIGSSSPLKCPVNTASKAGSGSVEDCDCLPGYYLSTSNIMDGIILQILYDCLACPTGGFCEGGKSLPYPKPGWWNSKAQAGYTFLPCPSGSDSCKGGSSNVTECLKGYGGNLCMECANQYFRLSSICLECSDSVTPIVFDVIGFIVVVLVIRMASSSLAGTSVMISVSFLQILSLFAWYRLQWSGSVRHVFSFISLFNLNLDLLSLSCFTSFGYTELFYMTLSLPILAFIILLVSHFLSVLVWWCGKLRAQTGEDDDGVSRTSEYSSQSWRRTVRAFITILCLMYVELCLKAFEPFQCTDLNFMDAAPEIQCWTGVHDTLVIFSGIATALYVVGIPLFVGVFLFRRRKEKKYYWWELVMFGRKLILVLATVFLVEQPLFQLFSVTLALLFNAIILFFVRPFRRWGINMLFFSFDLILGAMLLSGGFYVITMSEQALERDSVSALAVQLIQLILFAVSVVLVFGAFLYDFGLALSKHPVRSVVPTPIPKSLENSLIWQYWKQRLPEDQVPLLLTWIERTAKASQKRVDMHRATELCLKCEKAKNFSESKVYAVVNACERGNGSLLPAVLSLNKEEDSQHLINSLLIFFESLNALVEEDKMSMSFTGSMALIARKLRFRRLGACFEWFRNRRKAEKDHQELIELPVLIKAELPPQPSAPTITTTTDWEEEEEEQREEINLDFLKRKSIFDADEIRLPEGMGTIPDEFVGMGIFLEEPRAPPPVRPVEEKVEEEEEEKKKEEREEKEEDPYWNQI